MSDPKKQKWVNLQELQAAMERENQIRGTTPGKVTADSFNYLRSDIRDTDYRTR
jgi:hypothetical protein